MTPKQKRFCQEYLIDLNATQAAVRAGYSEKTAYSIGQRMLKNVEVDSYIKQEVKRIQNQKIADTQEILEYLTSVMRGEQKEEIPILFGGGAQILEQKDISAKDRIKAAELLGKRYGLFTDKLEVDGVEGIQIMDNIPEGEKDESSD